MTMFGLIKTVFITLLTSIVNCSKYINLIQKITWKKHERNKVKWIRLWFCYYNVIDNSNIINIHKYLMKKHDMK